MNKKCLFQLILNRPKVFDNYGTPKFPKSQP